MEREGLPGKGDQASHSVRGDDSVARLFQEETLVSKKAFRGGVGIGCGWDPLATSTPRTQREAIAAGWGGSSRLSYCPPSPECSLRPPGRAGVQLRDN